MKLKRLVTLGVVSITLLSQSTMVFADSPVTTEKSSAEAPSSFSYGTGSAIVSLPTDLSPEADRASNTYMKADEVSARGNINKRLKLKVKAKKTIDYSRGSDDSEKLEGSVYFGTYNNVAYWSADQLKAGADSADARVSQPLTIKVADANKVESAEYNGNLTFDIALVDVSDHEDLAETSADLFSYEVIPANESPKTYTYKTGVDTTETYTYTPEAGTIRITGLAQGIIYNSLPETIVTPKEIDGKKVTEVDIDYDYSLVPEDNEYRGSARTKNIYISEGVKYIGGSTTNKSIDYISLPDSLECIGNRTYLDATNIHFGNSLKYIGDNTRSGSVTELNLPASLKAVGSHAFYQCTQLKNIYIPEGVESIGDDAFGLSRCTSLTIPSSVKYCGFTDTGLMLQKLVYKYKAGANPVIALPVRTSRSIDCPNLVTIVYPANAKLINSPAIGVTAHYSDDVTTLGQCKDIYIVGSKAEYGNLGVYGTPEAYGIDTYGHIFNGNHRETEIVKPNIHYVSEWDAD